MASSVEMLRAKSAYQIFLIDDEQIVLDLYCSVLRNAGYRNVHAFSKAGDAISMLRCLRPNLILTDIHMPDVSGNILTRLIREFNHLESIPIIAITADVRDVTANKILQQGADAVLLKPLTPDELVGQVAAARAREATAESQSYR